MKKERFERIVEYDEEGCWVSFIVLLTWGLIFCACWTLILIAAPEELNIRGAWVISVMFVIMATLSIRGAWEEKPKGRHVYWEKMK